MAKRRRPNPNNKPVTPKAKQPSPPGESRAELVYITPEKAEQWLLQNTDNRPGLAVAIKKISRQIRIGEWTLNGETIKFDIKGVLRDGQTRLKAIVAADIAVWSWVIFDLDSGYVPFESIDQIRVRTLGHLLAIRGYSRYNQLASAARLVYHLDSDILASEGGFSWRVGLTVVEDRPEILDSLKQLSQWGVGSILSLSVAAGLHHLMRRKDKNAANAFWEQIGTSVIRRKDSPVAIVRDAIVRNRGARPDAKLSPTKLQAIIIKGWNLTRLGKTRRKIHWDSEKEQFPTIS